MKCTEHDRERCSHCAVLARCAALLPDAPDEDEICRGSLWRGRVARWNTYGYEIPWHETVHDSFVRAHVKLSRQFAEQIAARLVAWIRWSGVCPRGHDFDPKWLDGQWSCRFKTWPTNSRPLLYCNNGIDQSDHPLDPLGLTWSQRVKMSGEECRVCVKARQMHRDTLADPEFAALPPVRDGLREWASHVEECTHDGIAWDFVSIVANQLDQDKPVGWHAVHAWREPSTSPLLSRVATWHQRQTADRADIDQVAMLESMQFTLRDE